LRLERQVMLGELITGDLFSLVFVFARIGAALMLLPGFGEVFVAARVRLLLAIAISVVVAPVVGPYVPPTPDGPLAMFGAIGHELVIGIFLGAMARMLMSALHIAGVIVGFQTSLSNAQMFDPINSGQGSIVGSFFNVLGVFLIFASNLHHLMLMAVIDSYTLFVPGAPLPLGDFSDVATRILSKSFVLGMQIASPFIVMGMLFFIGMGLLARLMPQVQVFFIAMPIQIYLGFSVMTLTLSASMMWFLSTFQDTFQNILLPG
jgi:flagellar biosynthetic protein FliR